MPVTLSESFTMPKHRFEIRLLFIEDGLGREIRPEIRRIRRESTEVRHDISWIGHVIQRMH